TAPHDLIAEHGRLSTHGTLHAHVYCSCQRGTLSKVITIATRSRITRDGSRSGVDRVSMPWQIQIKLSVLDGLQWFGKVKARQLLEETLDLLRGDPLAETKKLRT